MKQVTLDELRNVYAFNNLPDEHLQWILDRAEYYEYEDGSLIFKTGDPVDIMWVIIEGKVTFYMDVNGRLVHYFTFDNDVQTGGVGGLLPYSRLKNSPGNTYAVGKVRGLSLHKQYFHELEQLNPDLIQKLIGYMTERARSFATTQLQHEKVNALGKLSAGIAHELNNPAAAISRVSADLLNRLMLNYELTEKLLKCGVSPDHLESIRLMVTDKSKSASSQKKLTAMQRMGQEDEINDWLDKMDLAKNKIASETFSDAGITVEDFEQIFEKTGKHSFVSVFRWLENLLSSERLIKDLGEASGRISKLVTAIKSHVHMDRTNDLQPTIINEDIENALTLLGYKLRGKNIKVTKKYLEDLPLVPAYVGELNQVWTNLIDNAIYALPQNGELTIETCMDYKSVKVKVIDNGSGIDPKIISRIFDPFFTTKSVGQGTGIGLDLVNRIVKRHNGDIKVNSVPGRTEFIICIPLNAEKPPA